MEPLFSEKQLQEMNKENMAELLTAMQAHQKKQETRIQLLTEKMKELEFMNALLSGRLALAQRKQFGSSSEKYADGYTQMDLFNEAEQQKSGFATKKVSNADRDKTLGELYSGAYVVYSNVKKREGFYAVLA